jgi:DNA-binding transcriptional regulator YhcF (GntR family)
VIARVAKILLEQEITSLEAQQQHHLTQQEMAVLASTAREVVGRALKELGTAGVIEMQQGRAVAINRERFSLLSAERRRFLMAHRHPTLYLLLSLLFLLLALILIFLSVVSARLFLFSPFSLILAFSYFHLWSQEKRRF